MRSNDTKELSWMIDLQYPRLTILQEMDRKDESNKINGTTIKSVCSGGDPQKSRRNHSEIMEFVIGTKLLLMVNDLPRVEPADALETCIQFNSGKQFKTKEFIDNIKNELNEKIKDIENEEIKQSIMGQLDIYLLADDTIKDSCKSIEWCNAFILLLLRNFKDTKLEALNETDLKEDTNDTSKELDNTFIFTKNVCYGF